MAVKILYDRGVYDTPPTRRCSARSVPFHPGIYHPQAVSVEGAVMLLPPFAKPFTHSGCGVLGPTALRYWRRNQVIRRQDCRGVAFAVFENLTCLLPFFDDQGGAIFRYAVCG